MSCDQPSDAAERYVSNGMTEEDRAAFEAHFFECGTCLADVQNLQEVGDALAAPAAPPASGRVGWRPLHGWLAAAAAVIVAIGLWFPAARSRLPNAVPLKPTPATAPSNAERTPSVLAAEAPPGPPHSALTALAIVTAPRYVALPTRSARTADANAFDAAMRQYAAGRYDAAAQMLAPLVRTPLDLPHAAFFLGISDLMDGRLDAARAALDKVAASGATPYADEAHFYLAKIDLRAGDAGAARRELEIAVGRDAGPSGEARRLLAALPPPRR